MTDFDEALTDFVGVGTLAEAAGALGVDGGVLVFWPFALPPAALAKISERLQVPLPQIEAAFEAFTASEMQRTAAALCGALAELYPRATTAQGARQKLAASVGFSPEQRRDIVTLPAASPGEAIQEALAAAYAGSLALIAAADRASAALESARSFRGQIEAALARLQDQGGPVPGELPLD